MRLVGDRVVAEGALEHRGVLGRQIEALLRFEQRELSLHFLLAVAEVAKGRADGLVDEPEHAAAREQLRANEAGLGLDTGRVAIHHEGNSASRRDHN